MTLKILLIIFLTFVLSCRQPTHEVGNTFIVPTDSMLIPKKIGNQPPPPPPIKEYYFPSNFIIDTGGHIYYYQQRIKTGWTCGTEMEWNTPPTFIDLQPKDIIEILSIDIENFIMANIQYLDHSDRQFAIGSTTDTATSFGLIKIFTTFKDTSNHITWTFRRTTQEENVVLAYKKNKKKYYPEEVVWDSTKILFIPKLEKYKICAAEN